MMQAKLLNPNNKRNREYYWRNRGEIATRKAKDYLERGDEIRSMQRSARRKRDIILKKDILTHYSNDRCACVRCGESRLACLSIDHINGGGTQHMKQVGVGSHFYQWLKNNNYPAGYQTLCMNCQWVKKAENNEGTK